MKKVNKEKGKETITKVFDWLLSMFGHTLVFIFVTSIFDSIYIDKNHIVLWSIIIVLIISILNKTIKPILVTLTIPITGLTLGLFYPCINVFILKLVDWLLKDHFDIKKIYIALFAAVLLSIMNFIVEEIIDKLTRKVHKHE